MSRVKGTGQPQSEAGICLCHRQVQLPAYLYWLNYVHVHVSRVEDQTAQQQSSPESSKSGQVNGETADPHRQSASSLQLEVHTNKRCCLQCFIAVAFKLSCKKPCARNRTCSEGLLQPHSSSNGSCTFACHVAICLPCHGQIVSW